MNAFALFAQILGFVLCAAILARAEPAINRMGRDTPRLVRIAFVLLAVGAVAGIFAIAAGAVPEWHALILAAGIAALLLCERRLRILTRTPSVDKGVRHHAQG
jgi:ammonia channel protein AmtB